MPIVRRSQIIGAVPTLNGWQRQAGAQHERTPAVKARSACNSGKFRRAHRDDQLSSLWPRERGRSRGPEATAGESGLGTERFGDVGELLA